MSKIEWTNKTWNPIIGCSKISEGCKNCYAEKMAGRLANIKSTMDNYSEVVKKVEYKTYYRGLPEWNGNTHFIESALNKPLSWKKPRMIFVCSMSDLFHENNTFEDILRVWDIMCQTPRHTYQVLTKRPERMFQYYKWLGSKVKNDGFDSIPSSSKNILDYITTPNHIWIGVTAENHQQANKRIPVLLDIPAKHHFVSCEPLLSNIDFSDDEWYNYLEGYKTEMRCYGGSPFEQVIETKKLDWVIAGPETGPNKRPMKKEWIKSLYNQCKAANVPFFDKKDTLGLNLKQFPNE